MFKRLWLKAKLACLVGPRALYHLLLAHIERKKIDLSRQGELLFEQNSITPQSITTHLFFYHEASLKPDNWLGDYFDAPMMPTTYWQLPWTKLIKHIGQYDIKLPWEPSRFYWAAQNTNLAQFNAWLSHWCKHNPYLLGPNWVCGQETAVRLVSILLTLRHHQADFTPYKKFIYAHLERIESTLHYALAQNNNHATSEAAAFFIAAAFLKKTSYDEAEAAKIMHFETLGRKWLEERVRFLIMPDGTFAQYSITYHRMMLDALSLCIWCVDQYQLAPFSEKFIAQYRLATDWLTQMLDPISGDAPNLGANDGTQFFKLDRCDYRNFKPTVQLAQALAYQRTVYENGPWNEGLSQLGISYPSLPYKPIQQKSKDYPHGGLVKFVANNAWGLLRTPAFKFRPSQADIFHFDFWLDGQNILQDAGSYSYNTTPENEAYFAHTKAHNTIEFDGHTQMPKVSRFMHYPWLNLKDSMGLKNNTWQGRFIDNQGIEHQREVLVKGTKWLITDTFKHHKQAVLRWRLHPDIDWQLIETGVLSPQVKISIQGSGVLEIKLETGQASRYYQEKHPLPVLTCKVGKEITKLITTIEVQ